jgi:hypothetical protein
MRPETVQLAARLLQCHAQIRAARTPATVTPKDLIPYGKLCDDSGLSYLTRGVGPFLGELAQWCFDRGLPPLNSLAINAGELKPGPGYDDAAGCSEITWWKEVQACVGAQYPACIR